MMFFKLFSPVCPGWQKFLWVHAQIADNFWSNSFAYGNLSLLAPYFRLFRLLAPLKDLRPRQLSDWPPLYPALALGAILYFG